MLRDRQVLELHARQRRRSIAGRRLEHRGFRGHGDAFRGAADLKHQRFDHDAVAAADLDALSRQRSEAVHRDLDGVGVRGDVRNDVLSFGVGDDGRGLGALRLADDDDRGARDHAALRVRDFAGDGAGGDLRRRGCRDSPCDAEGDREHSLVPTLPHRSSWRSCRSVRCRVSLTMRKSLTGARHGIRDRDGTVQPMNQ